MGRGVVEVDVGMAGEPPVDFRLMGIEVVQDDVEFLIGIFGDKSVHEAQELASFAPLEMAGLDHAGSDVQCGKQRGGAVSLVFVVKADKGFAVGQLEPPLYPLQRLDRRLFVDAQYKRVVGVPDTTPRWLRLWRQNRDRY